MGADDYLPKPFSLLELQSRMQAIIRRKFGVKNNIVSLGNFAIDLTDRTISYYNSTLSIPSPKKNLT
jgi:two-component system OmpR family response regulator